MLLLAAAMLASMCAWLACAQLTTWLLRRRGLLVTTAGVLLLVACADSAAHRRAPSHYDLLSVRRGESAARIKVAFKAASLEVHPDHNPSPTAAQEFVRLSNAHEMLSNDEQRGAYDRLGEEAASAGRQPDQVQLGVEMFAFYALWAVIAFALTNPELVDVDARVCAFAVLMLCVITETMVLVLGRAEAMPDWVLPGYTVRELCLLLRRLYPFVLVTARCVGMLEVSGSPVTLHLLMREVLVQSAEVCEAAAAVRAVAAAPASADKQQ